MNKTWRNDRYELHREDGPAVEHINGDKAWFINGKRHRDDNAARNILRIGQELPEYQKALNIEAAKAA